MEGVDTKKEDAPRLSSHESFPELSQERGIDRNAGSERAGNGDALETNSPSVASTKPKPADASTPTHEEDKASTTTAAVEKEQQPGLANAATSSANQNPSPPQTVSPNMSTEIETTRATAEVNIADGSGAKSVSKPELVHQKSQTQTLSTVHEEGASSASPGQGQRPGAARSVATGSKGSVGGGKTGSHLDSDTSEQSTSNNITSTPREYPTEFVPLLQKVEGNYRMFAPVRASALPSFTKFGDVGEESFAILELIRKSLETVNQSMHDLVRVDVRLVNVGQLKYFDDIYEQYFQNMPVPQRNVVSVEPMDKGCSIEVEVTSLIRDAMVQSGANSGRRDMDHSSFGKASFGEQGTNANRAPFDPASMSFFACLGDILPARLAQAYGYYGEKQEQVLSGLLILTMLRYLLMVLAIVSIALVETSDYESLFENTYETVRGPTWFVVVASLSVVHSFLICVYSFVWWYQGDEMDAYIEATFFWVMISLQRAGDMIFVFASVSAFTAIATLVPFTPVVTGKTRARFIGASVLSCFMFLVYIFAFKLSWHTKRVFKQLGNRVRALRDTPLKPSDVKMEGVTTPVSQSSSAYNLAHVSNSNSNARLITPNSGLGNHHIPQQYGTPMTVSSGMRIQQSMAVRSSTPSSGGSKHHHAQQSYVPPGPIQVVQQYTPGPGPAQGPIGVTTPNSQSKRIITQSLNNGQVQYYQQYDGVSAVNPNQVFYIQQPQNAPFQQDGAPPLGRIVQHQQQYYQQSPTGYSSLQQQPQQGPQTQVQMQQGQPQIVVPQQQSLEELSQPQTQSPSSTQPQPQPQPQQQLPLQHIQVNQPQTVHSPNNVSPRNIQG